MKECLQCKKEYKAERDNSKFCSANCRVKYHRANPKVKVQEVTPIQVQALFNSMMETLGRLEERIKFEPVTPKSFDGSSSTKTLMDEAGLWETPKKQPLKRTSAHWVELRRECESADDYAKWLEDLENDQFLTSREKSQIKQTV